MRYEYILWILFVSTEGGTCSPAPLDSAPSPDVPTYDTNTVAIPGTRYHGFPSHRRQRTDRNSATFFFVLFFLSTLQTPRPPEPDLFLTHLWYVTSRPQATRFVRGICTGHYQSTIAVSTNNVRSYFEVHVQYEGLVGRYATYFINFSTF